MGTFRMDCKLFLVIASVVVLASLDLKNQAAARSCGNVRSEGITVFNFTDVNTDVSDWVEVSDNVRTTIVGQSKATLVLQKNSAFQRGIFFGLLNPQVGGACFAGVRHPIKLELAPASLFTLLLRAQGALTHFKVILRHHGELGSKFPTYEHTFEVPTGGDELRPVFSIFEFKPYTNGTLNMDVDPLDASDITDFGIQVAGGVNEDYKQSGPATLEIDWISAANYC